MRPDRASGYLRPPTAEQLRAYAARHFLRPGTEDLDRLLALVTASLQGLDRIDELDEPVVELRHPHRDPGRPPGPGEDPYNAFIRFCEVRGAPEGRLSGRTLAVKDCIAVAGVPMTNGGRRTPFAVPGDDAVVVERLLDAGVTVTGKTNLDDLALGLGEGSAFGPSRNPRNPRFSPGGSSSGSAAAVAASMVDLALGADEGGSVRIPAAWCGLVGMKATHGLVPSYGLTYMDHTIDHIGPITKSVADNALMLEVMAGSDWRDPQWVRGTPKPGEYVSTAERGVSGLRIGVLREALEPSGCTPDVSTAFEQSLTVLSRLGARVVEHVSVPLWADAWPIGIAATGLGLYGMTITNGIGFGHLGRVDPGVTAAWASQAALQADDLPELLKTMLLTTDHVLERYQGVPFAKAQNLRLELRRQISATFDDVDLVVTPTTARGAFELIDHRAGPDEMAARMRETMGAGANTMQLDLSGHPALSVPCGTGDNDLPLGLQIVAPHFAEERCYQAGFAFERAMG
jgi:amidase